MNGWKAFKQGSVGFKADVLSAVHSNISIINEAKLCRYIVQTERREGKSRALIGLERFAGKHNSAAELATKYKELSVFTRLITPTWCMYVCKHTCIHAY